MSFRGPEGRSIPVLKIDKWELPAGAQVALLGPSGTGKTTFLHLLAGIRTPTAGAVMVAGRDIGALSESARDEWRSRTIGYVFQNYYLFPALTVLDNTVLPLTFAGCPAGERTARAREILDRLELGHRSSFYPRQLSAGEKQRAIIARAVVNRPQLILADEPSANLDARRRMLLMQLLRDMANQHSSTLVVATHDETLAAQFTERVAIENFK